MIHRFLKYGSLIILSAIIVIVAILGINFGFSRAAAVSYDIVGWFWTKNYSWISLSSDNSDLQPYSGYPYKVFLEDNNLKGWGWIGIFNGAVSTSTVGWVCFGSTCASPPLPPTTAPDGLSPTATLEATGKIRGWAKIWSLGDQGWIRLDGDDRPIVPVPNQNPHLGVRCYDCQQICTRWTQSCSETGCVDVAPCLEYDQEKFESCKTCFTATSFDGESIPDDTIPIDQVPFGGNGYICSDCTGTDPVHDNKCYKEKSLDYVTTGFYRVVCNTCASCNLYGGKVDTSNGGLVGWGWNGDNTGKIGAGWVQFNPSWAGTGIVYPWLQTQYGSIFTGGSARQRSIISNLNATYCIFAQQAFNFQSGSCVGAIPNIAFKTPQPNTYSPIDDSSYRNVLGRIDVLGLMTPVNGSRNKFGNIIESASPDWSQPLNNKVYYINGDLTLGDGNSPITIANGDANQQGNGIIIIDGNLNIKSDLAYAAINNPNDLTDLKQLASIAWVVKGDVIVDGAVTKTVGAFLVLGDPNATCQYTDGSTCTVPAVVDYPKYQSTGYGIFFSGASSDPLTISGLIVAKAGDFSRTYTSPTRGSEKIIYDGRLIANPPPGLKGLIEAMPIIRDF